jgi:hypothetical protein
VLESKFVGGHVVLNKEQRYSILVPEFLRFPDGYKDFKCERYGGVGHAHRLFGAQVITGKEDPGFVVTDLVTPKVEYSTSSTSVPGYIAVSRQLHSQFQLATPKTRDFERYLRRKGYSVDEQAPGDHRRIIIGNWKIHLNSGGGHIDLATLKELAQFEQRTVRQLIQEVRG